MSTSKAVKGAEKNRSGFDSPRINKNKAAKATYAVITVTDDKILYEIKQI